MRIIDVEQGSREWVELRYDKVMGSDFPVILEESPFKGPAKLWEEKVNRVSKTFVNKRMRRGITLEPKVRAVYEGEHGPFPPIVVEWEKDPLFGASLDGFNSDLGRVIEIKAPNPADHKEAKKGKVPAKYWSQVQGQLMVTGAESLHYLSVGENLDDLVLVEVEPDPMFHQELRDAGHRFWEYVETKTPPPSAIAAPTPAWEEAARQWLEIKKHIETLDLGLKAARSTMEREMEKAGVKRMGDGDLSATWVKGRAGSIDYSKIKELKSILEGQGIDLENYRKKGTDGNWRFNIRKAGS